MKGIPNIHKSIELFLAAQAEKYGVDLTNPVDIETRMNSIYNEPTGTQIWFIDGKEVMRLSRQVASERKIVFVLELSDNPLILLDKEIDILNILSHVNIHINSREYSHKFT